MKKIIAKVFIVIWMLLLTVPGAYYLIAVSGESTYSPEENRNLAGLPQLSAENIAKGEFDREIENFLLDHFPGRSKIISGTKDLQSLVSFADYEDYVLIAEGPKDELDTEDYLDSVEDLLGDLLKEPAPTGSAATEEPLPTVTPRVTQEPQVTEPAQVTEEAKPQMTGQPTKTPEPTATPLPQEYPPIEPKPAAAESDFADVLGTYMNLGGEDFATSTHAKANVLAVTAVLNKYARLLPEDGKLMFTVVPQSIYGTRFANASVKNAFYSTTDEAVNAFGDDNVYAFDAAGILGDAMKAGEYVYFRTDMHWTPYGSYLVYRDMAERAGKEACDYETDFLHTIEEPFRGTYYRDNPTAYAEVEADLLDLLMPDFPLEWRRITGKDTYTLIDFLDFNAKANDRYTVYLGGPAGPWTYAECDNGQEENCLLITDSFGLGFLPLLTQNYKQVHYYDTRYYDGSVVGYTPAEMIEKYNIQDIYVVVGDLHSYDSSFLLKKANAQLYGE